MAAHIIVDNGFLKIDNIISYKKQLVKITVII